jgi:diguanylate cyclase (GGDEF)-like protein/PAS domain S-box-containing protein
MAKVLIVDDHELNREFLLTLLGFSGYEVLQAADGREGLVMLEAGAPDLIISDILMPNMDGNEFVRQVRLHPKYHAIPIIFYTATYREREALAMASASGVGWVLPKPSEPDVILRTVSQALGEPLPVGVAGEAFPQPDGGNFAGIDQQLAAVLGKVEASSHQMIAMARAADVDGERHDSMQESERSLSESLSNLQAVGLRLTALIELGIDLAAERDPARLIDTACRIVQNICVAKCSAIGIVGKDGEQLSHFSARGLEPAVRAAFTSAPVAAGIFQTLIGQSAPLRLYDDARALTVPGLPPGHPPVSSLLGVAIATPTFGEVDERALSTVATQLAVAYENLVLYEEVQRHDAHLRVEVAQRVHAQESLHRILRARMVMAECNHVMVHAMDEVTLLDDMCRTVVRSGAYRMAWIGYVDEAGNVTPIAQAGSDDENHTPDALAGVANLAQWYQVSGAFHTGRSQSVVDVLADPQLAQWHKMAAQLGLRAALTLPMRDERRVFGVLTIYENIVNAFDAGQVAMFEELADDISYGVVNLRTRSARAEAEGALRESENKLNNILVSIDNVVWSARGEALISISPVAEKLYGRPVADFYADPLLWLSLVHPDDQVRVREWLSQLAGNVQASGCEFRIVRADGAERWLLMRGTSVRDAQGQVIRLDGVAIDITERKEYERRIEYLANHDALTDLANRNLLGDRLQQALELTRRDGRLLGVLFLDLDRFKDINDSVGHSVGDALLRSVAARLAELVRSCDTVARQGGDEFIILLSEPKDGLEVGQVAQRIVDGLAAPFVVGGHELHVTASIGVTVFPLDGDDMQALLRNADTAMYRAKEENGNNFQFYSRDMGLRALERASLETALRHAIERNEFELVYQPKVDLAHGRIIGAEALIRWRHPELGLVSPVRFIPLAEDTGLIIPIGEWVLRTACLQNKAWQDAGLPLFRVAVNLSARQFRQASLVQDVADILQESGLEAQYLELELTESLVMHDAEQFIAKLGGIKALGVRLSIDDFGTGYSSLSYLKRFPIDTLKIDQSFVRDIVTDADDAAIVRSIISLGHSLNLKVIAEGVETEAQLAYLRHHRCDEMQGYFFSRPLAPEAFATLLV